MMRSSYKENDVIILLKDITGLVEPLDTEKRELKIQQGTHYSEMLPLEYKPTDKYMGLYRESLMQHSKMTAESVAVLSEKIWTYKGKNVVLVSLARAGTPIGILIKHYLKQKFGCDVPHFTISIIRGRGIDNNAMKAILKSYKSRNIQFVDGWIGKGAIARELKKEVQNFKNLDGELAVLADPARITNLYGTSEDYLIPSACLNATVSGLFSRTILNKKLIGNNDFHGAVYYENLESEDVSYEFINAIEKYFDKLEIPKKKEEIKESGIEEVNKIAKDFTVSDVNFIKPGIGETTRVLLRRVPYKILVKDKNDTKYIDHIVRLCTEKNVEIIEYPLKVYRACGIIKNVSADI